MMTGGEVVDVGVGSGVRTRWAISRSDHAPVMSLVGSRPPGLECAFHSRSGGT